MHRSDNFVERKLKIFYFSLRCKAKLNGKYAMPKML